MTEKIIRNPQRGNNAIKHAPGTYVPEHVRLNRVPIKIPPPTLVDYEEHVSLDGDVLDENEPEFDLIESTTVPENHVIEHPVPMGEYILMISDKVVCSGSLELISSKIDGIVYGNDPEIDGDSLEPDDFVVLKRMKISFGVSIK